MHPWPTTLVNVVGGRVQRTAWRFGLVRRSLAEGARNGVVLPPRNGATVDWPWKNWTYPALHRVFKDPVMCRAHEKSLSNSPRRSWDRAGEKFSSLFTPCPTVILEEQNTSATPVAINPWWSGSSSCKARSASKDRNTSTQRRSGPPPLTAGREFAPRRAGGKLARHRKPLAAGQLGRP